MLAYQITLFSWYGKVQHAQHSSRSSLYINLCLLLSACEFVWVYRESLALVCVKFLSTSRFVNDLFFFLNERYKKTI